MYTVRTQQERLWISMTLRKLGCENFGANSLNTYTVRLPLRYYVTPVGFYFPVKQGSKSPDIAALQAVAAQFEYLLSQKGISADDIVREFRQMCEADRTNQRKDLDE
jgi:hypothetical protein